MRLHRFCVEQKIGEKKELTVSDPELAHQLAKVFRFKPARQGKSAGGVGDKVIVFDGSGFEYEAEIVSLNKREVVLKIIKSSQDNSSAPGDISLASKNVSLYLSIIKKDNFELAVEKCTEIGVAEIHPIISERSEKKDLNLERLNKIVKEASEQSGRVTLPKVFEIVSLEEAVLQVKKEGREGVVFHTDTDASTAPNPSLQDLYTSRFLSTECSKSCALGPNPKLTSSDEGKGKVVAVFVGPEGGFTEKEMELFKNPPAESSRAGNNFQIYSLGQNILRAETAAIIAVWETLCVH